MDHSSLVEKFIKSLPTIEIRFKEYCSTYTNPKVQVVQFLITEVLRNDCPSLEIVLDEDVQIGSKKRKIHLSIYDSGNEALHIMVKPKSFDNWRIKDIYSVLSPNESKHCYIFNFDDESPSFYKY